MFRVEGTDLSLHVDFWESMLGLVFLLIFFFNIYFIGFISVPVYKQLLLLGGAGRADTSKDLKACS